MRELGTIANGSSMSFRLARIGIIADMENASLHIEFHKAERDVDRDTNDLRRSETYWIEITQEQFYLEADGHVNKRSKKLLLNPFLDVEGIMRLGGRLQEIPLPIIQVIPLY